MAQRSVSKQPQSDFQPIYDAIDALRPARLKATWQKMSHRGRILMLIMAALAVLLWSVGVIGALIGNYVRDTSGPLLIEALRSPYGLEGRLYPALEAPALPQTAGAWLLSAPPVLVTPPPAVKEGEPPIPVPGVSLESALNTCLVQTALGVTPEAPCAGVASAYALIGDYQTQAGDRLNMVMSQFASPEDARLAMRQLFERARTDADGRTGSYVLGVTEVDYFTSSGRRMYSFSWGHGLWVYTVTTPSFDAMEDFVRSFPH